VSGYVLWLLVIFKPKHSSTIEASIERLSSSL
jgi:hypothetical protein